MEITIMYHWKSRHPVINDYVLSSLCDVLPCDSVENVIAEKNHIYEGTSQTVIFPSNVFWTNILCTFL